MANSPDLGVRNTFGKAKQSMKNSAKLEILDHSTADPIPHSQTPLNFKIILFLAFSLVAIIFAMTPSRKAPGKKGGLL